MESISIFGVRIDSITREEAVDRALSSADGPCTVTTPNALILEACRKNRALGELLCRFTLSLPDGAGVLRAAKQLGKPLPCRIAGIEFGEALLQRAAEDDLRVFFLGGREGVAVRAAARMRTLYPTLSVCGTRHGYGLEQQEASERLLLHLHQCRPDLLFVCLGFPLQEQWIAKHLSALSGIRVIAGLGGSLDVWAGDVARAPHRWQKLGLEWAWRMRKQPQRIKKLPSLLRFALCRKEE